MRSGAAAAQSNIANRIAAADVLSGDDGVAGEMAIAGRYSVAVINGNSPPVTAHEVCERHHAICRSYYRLPVGSGYVDSAVKCSFAVEGIGSLAKRTGHWTFNRPKVRSRIGSQPVCGRCVTRK